MYGLTITTGLLLALLLAEQLIQQDKNFKKGDKNILWEGFLYMVVCGIIGARLYHVIDYWQIYKEYPFQVLQLWHGGLGIFGAIAGGLIGAMFFLKKEKQPVLKWLDLAGIVTPLGQAIGRWGNVFNKELLPYSIYESAFNLILFLMLFLLFKSEEKLKQGTFIYLYLIGYGTIRVLLEPTKTQSWAVLGFNIAQTLGAIIIVIGFLGLYKLYGKRYKKIKL